ncbi:hypothetical protein PRCB_18545 [Pantoea rodasii]|uniref:Uncharacterized protein n=1 Tax=Pantoea rodasii TaxID=1076549 RepID=A0A2M9W8N4_9GAMM|nr:hypothetical protein PRCB_18545 [Pantoea rodasii]
MLCPSYFKLQVRWLRSFTPVTYLSKLQGIHSLAACLHLELFWEMHFLYNYFATQLGGIFIFNLRSNVIPFPHQINAASRR